MKNCWSEPATGNHPLLSISAGEQELVVMDILCVGGLLSWVSLIILTAIVSKRN